MRYKPWHTKDIANIIKARQANKFDVLVLVTGARGNGKSSKSVKILLRLPGFNMKRDIVFSRQSVIEHVEEKTFGKILADEFINVGFNRDFYDEQQKKLIKMLNMYRDSGNIIFMCVPNFASVDKQLRQLCKFRLDVIRRGWAVLHTPNESSYSSDPWDMAVNEKIERSWRERGVKKPDYRRLTTFRAMVRITDLTDKQRKLYEKVKKEKRSRLYEAEIKEDESKSRSKYEDLYNELMAGELDRERFDWYCKMQRIKPHDATQSLNVMLRNNRVGKTFTQLLSDKGQALNPILTNPKKNTNVV